jgi:RimJ/RimL family protein N-acetyltransferase
MPTTYRLLNQADRETYKKLRLECLQNYPENFGTLYAEEMESDSLKFDKILSKSSGPEFLMGAFESDTIIGICGYIQEKRLKTRHLGEIIQMYVTPSFARKGIAANLLKISLEQAFSDINLEQITLGVVESNLAAIHIYQKAGFKQYGIFPKYYKADGKYETMVFMNIFREKLV